MVSDDGMPKDSDDWGNGKTLGEMRRLCPDPSLTAHERNNPIELAAIEAGLGGWDAWEVFDGNYSDHCTGLHVSPNTTHGRFTGGFAITWPGAIEPISTHEEGIALFREFCEAFLRLTSDSLTGSSNTTMKVTL